LSVGAGLTLRRSCSRSRSSSLASSLLQELVVAASASLGHSLSFSFYLSSFSVTLCIPGGLRSARGSSTRSDILRRTIRERSANHNSTSGTHAGTLVVAFLHPSSPYPPISYLCYESRRLQTLVSTILNLNNPSLCHIEVFPRFRRALSAPSYTPPKAFPHILEPSRSLRAFAALSLRSTSYLYHCQHGFRRDLANHSGC
jgi:hypothetical protein